MWSDFYGNVSFNFSWISIRNGFWRRIFNFRRNSQTVFFKSLYCLAYVFFKYCLTVCASLSFHFLKCFLKTRSLNFDELRFTKFFFYRSCSLLLCLRTLCLIQVHKDFSPVFSSKSFIVPGFPFRSVTHCELILVYGVRSSFLYVDFQSFLHHLLKRLTFLHLG